MPVISHHFSPDASYFLGHFPENPLVPAVVLLDCFERALFAEQGIQVDGWKKSKFTAPVLPSQTVDYHFEVSNRKLSLSAKVGEQLVCEAVAGLK
jgi:3-hydroxymyristoyl/3-hydroxydecanoyl-(acyl carrier protein) dehydratase